MTVEGAAGAPVGTGAGIGAGEGEGDTSRWGANLPLRTIDSDPARLDVEPLETRR